MSDFIRTHARHTAALGLTVLSAAALWAISLSVYLPPLPVFALAIGFAHMLHQAGYRAGERMGYALGRQYEHDYRANIEELKKVFLPAKPESEPPAELRHAHYPLPIVAEAALDQ